MSWIEEQFLQSKRDLSSLFGKKVNKFTIFEKRAMKIQDCANTDCKLLTALSLLSIPPQMVAARYYGLELGFDGGELFLDKRVVEELT